MSNEPMTIEEIPADQVVIMNEYWHRAFNAAGCDPACHCCWNKIQIGVPFKLGTVQTIPGISTNYPNTLQEAIDTYDEVSTSKEVMLCEKCTPEMFSERVKKDLKRRIKEHENRPSTQGCFRVGGKIIH